MHIVYGQQCRNAFDFQDNGFIRQDVSPESERQRFTLVHRRNPNFTPYEIPEGALSKQGAVTEP